MLTTSRKREQRSLFGEILDWMLAPLLVLWPISVGLTWLVAQDVANRPFDSALEDTARQLSAHVAVTPGVEGGYRIEPGTAAAISGPARQGRRYQLISSGHRVLDGDPSLPLPNDDEDLAPGELQFRDGQLSQVPVRIAYVRAQLPGVAPEQQPIVQVAETLGSRSRLASEIIKGVILPQLVILPLAVLLVWLALARGIRPLNELQRRIRSRDSRDLRPINEFDAPEEVSPLVLAINDLLERLDRSITLQKRFLANAAHQLKTPLAGLRTQAELAQREIEEGHSEPQALKKSLQHIARSSQRAAHMVNQLLAMARAEDREHAARQQPVSLAQLAREVVKDVVPRALEKRIDIGFELADDASASDTLIHAHPLLVTEMIRNLVDNALQYTPSGGSVTIRVSAHSEPESVTLQVEDSGPGIPLAERELVFHPFYRALGTNVDGSGLGLAIVRQIALDHGADIVIDDAHSGGPGARFTVRFPVITALNHEAEAASPTGGAPASPGR